MYPHLFVAIILFITFSITHQQSTYSVAIGSQATIIGYVSDNPSGLYFLGIPYAQPPIGPLRFANTQRKDPSGTINAFHFGSSCRQSGDPNGNEDCLFINIITPMNIVNQSYPVYFWIHGGAWVAGSGGLYVQGTLNNIANKGVVVVSINYRLGLYGFFSSRDSIVPGNMAMFDMMEGLNWVHRYISYFGGDASRITIGGESAGGWSVSWLTMSPMSQPLFNQALAESGAAYCPTLISYSETTRDHSRRLAVGTNCTTVDTWNSHDPMQMQATLDCLRNVDATMLDMVDANTIPGDMAKWGVVIDNAFINDTLDNLAMKRPPMKFMTGNCNNETLAWFGQLNGISQDNNYINRFTRQFLIDTIKAYHYELVFYNNSEMVRQQLQTIYIDNMPFADDDHVAWYKVFNELYGDWLFTGAVYRDAIQFASTGSDVYLWSFDYAAPEDEPNVPLDWQGVPHGYEVGFVFAYHNGNTQDSRDTIMKTGDFWSNFIIYGNPTPNATGFNRWPKLTNQGEFMSIQPQPIVKFNYHQQGAQFWSCTAPIIQGYTPSYCQ